MPTYLRLELASPQTEIVQQVGGWTVDFVERGPAVKLTALVLPDPAAQTGYGTHLGATSLIIHTDPAAAIVLAERILDLARTKGWRQPK